jgi:hypothetical protein
VPGKEWGRGALPDLVLDYHRLKTPIDHPDQSVTRAKLEYPTVGVSFAYLAAINKVVYSAMDGWGFLVLARNAFTDRSVFGAAQVNAFPHTIARLADRNNFYFNLYNPGASTADHSLQKLVAGTGTALATEAIDIDWSGRGLRISCSGSAIKSMRYELPSPTDPLALPTPNATLSATDTTFTSGYYGYRFLRDTYAHGGMESASTYLLAPASPGPEALAVVEAGIAGSGSFDDPFRPSLAQELVEIDPADPAVPDFLKLEKRKYDALKARGFTDEEMRLLLGYVPQHQIDRLAVTWGSIDFRSDPATGRPIAPTFLVAIYPSAPDYVRRDNVLKQIEYARSKGLRVYTPPFDIKSMHAREKRDRDWLITESELAYQLTGREDLEVDAVADFYERELINLGRIKNVEPWILDQTLDMWIERAKRLGRDRALEKLLKAKKR